MTLQPCWANLWCYRESPGFGVHWSFAVERRKRGHFTCFIILSSLGPKFAISGSEELEHEPSALLASGIKQPRGASFPWGVHISAPCPAPLGMWLALLSQLRAGPSAVSRTWAGRGAVGLGCRGCGHILGSRGISTFPQRISGQDTTAHQKFPDQENDEGALGRVLLTKCLAPGTAWAQMRLLIERYQLLSAAPHSETPAPV